MRHFQHIQAGILTQPILIQLQGQPELWDQFSERRLAAGTPHADMNDIWLRYRDKAELDADPAAYLTAHTPVFYPAWRALPAVRPLVFAIMERMQAVQLGGVMITRLPPGGRILPHDDVGSWHAEFFRTKAYVALSSNSGCWNECGGETIAMQTGDVWTFDNLVSHSVGNDGVEDRLTLIIALRCET